MGKKKAKSKRDPGVFIRLDADTHKWLEAKAAADERSLSSMLRKIVVDAKASGASA